MDSKLFTLHTIETLWNKIKNKFYVKSADGIPKSDLDTTVQSSLSKADTALQKHQDISGKLDKTGDASNTTVAFSAASARENVKTGEKLSVILGKIAKWFADLKTVAFTGSYNDLANKPTIPDVSGKQDKLTAGTNITISGNTISAKDTTYSDATQSAHGLMSAEDKKKLDEMDLTKYLPKDGTAKKDDGLSTGKLKFGYIHNGTNTATSGKTWARVAYCVVSKGYTTITMAMLVTSGNSGVGLFDIDFRTNANCDGFEYFNVKQIITNFPERVSINDIKAISKSTSDGMQYEIWYNIRSIYGTRQFTCLSEQLYSGANSNKWKFETHTAADFVSSPPADGTEATYKNCGVVSTAETLTDSGWVNMTLESYSESGTVKYRIYGKQITITGEVVLKNNVATSYYAPQAIASTTLDFSKIVGCSGVGRSSSGKGVYVNAENFNGDNIVCVYALGGEIAAGKTLYFTITGFIN